MKKSILIIVLFFSISAHAADYLMVIGAGGEDGDKVDTIFDDAIKNLAAYTKRSPGIRVDVALDGGHIITDAIIKKQFPASVEKSNFLASDYARLIEKYKKKLESNEIGPNDQLMIFVDSHGAEKQPQFKTHSIATSASTTTNLNTLEGAQTVDLDQLEILKNLAKEKGVKMAIVDGSCHSGNTLALADDNTCVIAGTGPNHYGYGAFPENFVKEMKKGKNLEEIFLKTREADLTNAFPMISTDENAEITSTIYDKISPYLYKYDDKDDKMTPYLIENNDPLKMCIADQNFNSLLETIDKANKLNTFTKTALKKMAKTKKVNFSYLEGLLIRYKKAIDTAALKMRELDLDRLKRHEELSVHAENNKFTNSWVQPYSWEDLLLADWDQLISETQTRLNNTTDPRDNVGVAGLLDCYTKARDKREEILRNNPDLKQFQEKEKEIGRSLSGFSDFTTEIAKEERRLYKNLYENARNNRSDKTKNACQNFKIR